MHELVPVLLLVSSVAGVAYVARRFNWSAPVLLVIAGLAVSFLPGLPDYRLDPELVLVFFLPPLLYSAALNTSLMDFRANLRPIGLLSVGLVLFSTVVVGLVAYAVVPGLPLGAAFALGAIVAPPDAVAATAIARRVGLPARVVLLLEGESLVNDATALTAYRVAVAAVVTGSFSWLDLGRGFLVASAGGVLVGLAVAMVLARLRRHLDDPLVENTLSLITPFLAYLPAEAIHASGVLAVVVAGLHLGHRMPTLLSSETRLQQQEIWRLIDFLLQGVVFALIGLQLPQIVRGLRGESVGSVTWAAVAVTATVIVARFAYVYVATYLPRRLPGRLRVREEAPGWAVVTVVSWAGMRGVVSLAAAFALPLTVEGGGRFPQRDLLVFLTLVVILATLVLQGFSLPWLIRRLGLRPDETSVVRAEATAQEQASEVALQRLDELVEEEGAADEVVERLRRTTRARSHGAWDRLGDRDEGTETPSAAYRRLRRQMLDAERVEFIRQRDEGEITEEVLRRVQRNLDLEESMLTRD